MIIDHDDWGVTSFWFEHIAQILGRPSIDRFADGRNTKTARFNSRFYWPQCEAVDAFTQDWSCDLKWFVPPIYLVGRVIRYLRLSRADGILVVPVWKSAYYWPMVSDLLVENKHVKGVVYLGNIYRHYRNTNSLFGSDRWRSKSVAIHYPFDKGPHCNVRCTPSATYTYVYTPTDQTVLIWFFPLSSGILTSDTWSRLANCQNPIIRRVLSSLPDMVAASRTTNTVKAYILSYNRCEQWASDIEELSVFPANDLAITIYLLSLIQLGKSVSVLNQFVFAASWMHSIAGYPNPTKSVLVKTVLDGAKRTLSVPVSRKEPITPSMLRKIRRNLISNVPMFDLKSHRLINFMVLCYAGFFRF